MGSSGAEDMSREDWIASGRFLLSRYRGLFHGEHGEYLPPDPADRSSISRRFELFTRMCLLILPLSRADESIRVGDPLSGPGVAEFIEGSLARYCNPKSPDWIGLPCPGKSPFQLVQWAGLVLGLFLGPEGLWETINRRTRDLALENLSACVAHRTNAHNWRFFNVLGAAFLDRCGVPFDTAAEEEHLEQLLAWYAGGGWYRDGHDFDYYNAWAFQTYAALWSSLPRSVAYPEIRAQFVENFRLFIGHYPQMFSREGHSLLWGRSALYRFAACSPLWVTFLLPKPAIPGGLARRLCSGNLTQFIGREDVWEGPAPSMGFYRSFPPIVQGYSRSSSFGWMHKAFGCLALPPQSTFWTDPPREGDWFTASAKLSEHRPMIVVKEAGLAISPDPRTGDTMVLSGKVRSAQDPCYNRLAYFAHHLLEAETPEPPASLSYEATTEAHGSPARLTVSRIRFAGYESGVFYRQIYLGPPGGHHSDGILIDLADIPIPGGLLRVDRLRASFAHTLWLGGHSVNGHVDPIDQQLRGANGQGFSVMIPLLGWEGITAIKRNGTHAEFEYSTCLCLYRRIDKDAVGTLALLAAVIADIPVAEVSIPRITPTGRLLQGAVVEFSDERKLSVSFDGIEGRLHD